MSQMPAACSLYLNLYLYLYPRVTKSLSLEHYFYSRCQKEHYLQLVSR